MKWQNHLKKPLESFKDAIPFIKEAKEYASMGLIPAGCYENKKDT